MIKEGFTGKAFIVNGGEVECVEVLSCGTMWAELKKRALLTTMIGMERTERVYSELKTANIVAAKQKITMARSESDQLHARLNELGIMEERAQKELEELERSDA